MTLIMVQHRDRGARSGIRADQPVFLITANNYEFSKLLNVGVLVLAALVGLRFLTCGMARLNEYQEALAAEHERQSGAAAAVAADARQEVPDGEVTSGSESNGEGGSARLVAVLAKAPTLTEGHPTGIPPAAQPPAPPYRPASMTLLYSWILLFGFVGTRLAWTLRSFFGSPDEEFQIFRHIEGTFSSDVFRTIGHLHGG